MMPVYHRSGRRPRSAWAYRNLVLGALLTFCVVQVVVMVNYYNRINKDRSRQQGAKAADSDAAARSLQDSRGSGAASSSSGKGGTPPGSAGGTGAAAAPPPPRRRVKYISRREQERLLMQSTNYSEARVEALRAAQAEAAARLAEGVTPPVVGTSIFPPGNEDGPCVGAGPPPDGAVAAVVVVTFNRAKYLEQMLDSLLSVHGRDAANRAKFPLFVSQDLNPANSLKNASGVQDVVGQHLDRLSFLQHQETAPPVLDNKKEKVVYYRIANHYKFVLRTFFDCFGFQRLVLLEDDMQLSPDFFPYFEATAPVLDSDPTLMCVSSWNDHGQDRFVRNATQLYRSDFFPGLGWMLNTRVWGTIRDAWPRGYWDDFMRLSATRAGRQCIRPEVCRTYNFGDIGSSSGQYFRLFLKPVKLNQEDVPWGRMDLGYLEAGRYRRLFDAELAAAEPLESIDEALKAEPGDPPKDFVLRYTSQQHYEQLTGRLRMLREWRDGVPRGAYNGTVAVRNLQGARLFLAPSPDVDFSEAAFDPSKPFRVDSTGAIIRKRPVSSRAAAALQKRLEENAAKRQAAAAAAAAATQAPPH